MNGLNQSITLKQSSGVNQYNEHTYTTSTIKGRLEKGNKLVRNNRGEEVVSTVTLFTLTEIELNDLVEGRIVISVSPQINLNGTIHHYEVSLA